MYVLDSTPIFRNGDVEGALRACELSALCDCSDADTLIVIISQDPVNALLGINLTILEYATIYFNSTLPNSPTGNYAFRFNRSELPADVRPVEGPFCAQTANGSYTELESYVAFMAPLSFTVDDPNFWLGEYWYAPIFMTCRPPLTTAV